MNKSLLFLVLLIAIINLLSIKSFPQESWPMQGHDAQRTGRSYAPGPTAPILKWTYDPGEETWNNASPIVGRDGTIYMPSRGGFGFYAINPDGTLKWKKESSMGWWKMNNAPALSLNDSVVYVIYKWWDPHVTALSAQNGDTLWTFKLGSSELSDVSYSSFTIGVDGTIYIGTRLPAELYAINPDGTLKWLYEHPNSENIGIEAPPAIDKNGNIYVIINTVGLVALDSLGTMKWISSDLGDYGWPTPTIGPDGTLYVSGEYWAHKAIRAYNPDGSRKWIRSDIVGPGFFAGIAISNDGSTIYSARGGGKIYALKSSTGETIWVCDVNDPNESFGGSPALGSNGILYVMGDKDGDDYVYAISAVDGNLLWQYQCGNAYYWGPPSPAIGPDGTLYVCASKYSPGTSRLYAFFTSVTIPTTPILESPFKGAVDQPRFLKFKWEASLGAEMHHLQISVDSLFTNNVIDDSTILIVPYQVDSLDYITKYYWRVRAKNTAGTSGWSDMWNLTTVSTTGIKKTRSFPYEFHLNQNYPNPFNPTTIIQYSIPERENNSSVKLEINNIQGKLVRTLVSEIQTAGNYQIEWDAKDNSGLPVPSGLYLYRLRLNSFVRSKKMLLLK